MRVFMYQNEETAYQGSGAVVVARDAAHALELIRGTVWGRTVTMEDVVEVDLSREGSVMDYCYG
jgi:hypothetical protein